MSPLSWTMISVPRLARCWKGGPIDEPSSVCHPYSWIIVAERNCRAKEGVPMSSCCADLKVNQVWVCETCGLEIKVVKECNCVQEGAQACAPDDCLTCCNKPLKLKS